MNKVIHLPYLRHRWSSKSGHQFRCLRRSCDETRPRTANPICKHRYEKLDPYYPMYRRFSTHGGGVGPFDGPRKPRRQSVAKRGPSVLNESIRTELIDPRGRMNSRKRRRNRYRILVGDLSFYLKFGGRSAIYWGDTSIGWPVCRGYAAQGKRWRHERR